MKTIAFATLLLACASAPALAASEPTLESTAISSGRIVPTQLKDGQRSADRAVFAAIRAGRWDEARSGIALMGSDDPLRPHALSALYLAKNSPKVELFDLLDLLNKAPELPQAEKLAGLAKKRGAEILPSMPQVQKLAWFAGAPRRAYTPTNKADPVGQALAQKIQPFIVADDSAGAEQLLNAAQGTLTPESLTEMQQKVAWSYYIGNDDTNARRMAALAQQGSGSWTVQGAWIGGLSAWRQNDYRAAADAFTRVAGMSGDADMRAAGFYWAARAQMAAGQAAKVEPLLRGAARVPGSFYGLLARETLGMDPDRPLIDAGLSGEDWATLKSRPNVLAAIAFTEIGETAMADEALRHVARLSGDSCHASLLRLARALDLPAAQIWLAQNLPSNAQRDAFAGFPAPQWTPDGGWRVDRSLVFAHALQESRFQAAVVSPAGARGLMQVLPGTANLVAGGSIDPASLNIPSTNMEYGQRYLENLRDSGATGGLLPKVMAAYNAGPAPVARWNTQVRDNGDPLLFMESIPYYETRAYVNTVMRNYWIYAEQAGKPSPSITSMAQGLWPRFPGLRGASAVRMSYQDKAAPVAD